MKFLEFLVELDRERKTRVIATNAMSKLQVSLNKLKTLDHEDINKHNEFDYLQDDIVREKDEVMKELEETVKERDTLRSKIRSSSDMLVTGMEKKLVMVSEKSTKVTSKTVEAKEMLAIKEREESNC
ncbi:hypothetical protein LR48_Vigan252s005000 [Vigna angularis]|uniref:Uncharacterized protein n=1 Tax=Phaseolus angularis TaxID=3914 RepID=A0A0L9T6Y4_PHAAN|nr:hypothetical protein LR48_Vigan252s005000 [Vigna angularis]